MTDWESRKTAMTIGEVFRVLREAPSYPTGSFHVGDEVRLVHIGYSHYDNAHGYTFDAEDGTRKSYLLYDDEPVDRLSTIFAS